MTGSDGRSTFAALYLAIALGSLWLFDNIMNSNSSSGGYGAAGIAALCILFAVVFGIAGIYKLLTIDKGKSNNDDENNIEGEKSRNSNMEVRIWRDKKIVAIIILFGLFIITRF